MASSQKPDTEAPDNGTAVETDIALVEDAVLKSEGRPLSPEETIEALGIPNWRDLERKIVRRLDMTLMPCVWVLYFFN
jgi:hypothetical protein